MFPACWNTPEEKPQTLSTAQGCPQPPTLRENGGINIFVKDKFVSLWEGDDSSTVFSCSVSTGFTGIEVFSGTPRCPAGMEEGAGDGHHIPNLPLA